MDYWYCFQCGLKRLIVGPKEDKNKMVTPMGDMYEVKIKCDNCGVDGTTLMS